MVGVGGGIAAFKSVILCRELARRGAAVHVVMTKRAGEFIGASTFRGIARSVVTDLFGPPPSIPALPGSVVLDSVVPDSVVPDSVVPGSVVPGSAPSGEIHVHLGQLADAMVVAPATMNLIARVAHGFADDPVLATLACLPRTTPALIAPAMHTSMWQQASTQRNVAQLAADGLRIVGPTSGPLASGASGAGRMVEPEAIADALEACLDGDSRGTDLRGMRILVTAGPTVEDIDPVRYVGNRSSGRMGTLLVDCAVRRGAEVTMVRGPVALPPPAGARVFDVRSAREMHAEVMRLAPEHDAVVMAAAVADHRPADSSEHKIKKTEEFVLRFVLNPDILAELGRARVGTKPLLVGFALETRDVAAYGREKLVRKGADMIVANHADALGGERTKAILIDHDGEHPTGNVSKIQLAETILDAIAKRVLSSASVVR